MQTLSGVRVMEKEDLLVVVGIRGEKPDVLNLILMIYFNFVF